VTAPHARWAVLRAGVVASLHECLADARRAVGAGDTLDAVPEGVGVGVGDTWPPPRKRGRKTIGVVVEVRYPVDVHARVVSRAVKRGASAADEYRALVVRALGR